MHPNGCGSPCGPEERRQAGTVARRQSVSLAASGDPFDREPKGRAARERQSKVALVCAGGGVTGAVYEIGCLRALEELLDRSVLDLDLYVGVSGGRLRGLAAGQRHLAPRDVRRVVAAPRRDPFGVPVCPPLPPRRLRSSSSAPRRAPRVLAEAVMTTLTGEGRNLSDLALSLFELLPAGPARQLRHPGVPGPALPRRGAQRTRFDRLARELYLVAVDLDSGEAVAFGERGASRRSPSRRRSRPPRPARPLPPGPHRRAATTSTAGSRRRPTSTWPSATGADLVICINPIVPILNDTPCAAR